MIFVPTYFFPRSGSTVIDTMINQHPEFLSIGEIRHNDLEIKTSNIKKIIIENFLKYTQSRIIKNDKEIVGFQYCPYDLKYYMSNISCLQHAYFFKEKFKKIILIRRNNLLEQSASYLKAKSSNNWHKFKNEKDNYYNLYNNENVQIHNKEYEDKSIILNIDNVDKELILHFLPNVEYKNLSLKEFLELYEMHINDTLDAFKKSGIEYLDLIYEDDIQINPMIGIRKIEKFLNIQEFNGYEEKLIKTSRGLKIDLKNYDEIYEYLKNTKYDWMMNK